MFSSGSSDLPQSSLEIKQDDKFFSRLLSKESSRANPSLRVYYGGASGAVPFMWESQPGTPKHAFSDTALPPLTPPPAYHCTNSNNKPMINNHSRSNLLRALFLKISPKKSTNVSPYPSPLSSDSSSKYHGIRRRCFSQSSSSFDSREDDEGDRTVGSPTSTLCFGTAGRVAWGGRGRRGCYQF